VAFLPCPWALGAVNALKSNIHSLPRPLIVLRMAPAVLNVRIDEGPQERLPDDVLRRRLKNRRMALRSAIGCFARALQPQEPA
jgi:hypothetical protein